MTIDEVNEILNDLCDELPIEFFKDLSGGIAVSDEIKYNPASKDNDLYILAEYQSGGGMGCHILFYYGSIYRIFGHLNSFQIKDELRKILRHEFRHHVEGLSGVRDLEYEDERFIEDYLSRKNKMNSK